MCPIGVALLGGGIFATEAHLPALLKSTAQHQITLKAIWSRSRSSADKALQAWQTLDTVSSSHEETLAYSEDGEEENTLKALLARQDIQAVIVALPIDSQPDIVLQALQAGKHVLSEKPVAATVEAGRRMLAEYEKVHKARGQISFHVLGRKAYVSADIQVWRIAENWEVEPAHLFAAEAVQAGRIGSIRTFFIKSVLYVDDEGNKYFETAWRRKPQFQGGYLLDAGVHNAAVLRTVLPTRITHLSAYTTLQNDHLAPSDYLAAIARCDSDIHGQVLIDYGARGCAPVWELRITGSEGEIISQDVVQDGVDSFSVEIRAGKLGAAHTERKVFPKTGVVEEQRRFLAAIQGEEDAFGSVEGALHDVGVLQAALISKGSEISIGALS